MSEKIKQYDEEGRVIRENRSELKREREKIKDFAKELLKIPEKQYQFLSLNPEILAALTEAKKLEGNALRRHLIFLTRLLSEADLAKINQEFLQINQEKTLQNQKIKDLINLLLTREKEGLDLILSNYQSPDLQLIRRFLREIKKFNKVPENEGKKSKHWDKLFNYLKEKAEI